MNKGPHSLGSNNSNNIGIKYRDLHPSHLSHIDVLVCGNADPGTSGELSPFSPIKGLYFDDSPEPDEFYYNLVKELSEKYKKKGVNYITLEYDNPEDFYNALVSLEKFSNDNVTISSTSRTGNYDIVVKDEVDLDDGGAPSIDADAKKKTKKEKEEEAKRQKEEDEKLAALEEAEELKAKKKAARKKKKEE